MKKYLLLLVFAFCVGIPFSSVVYGDSSKKERSEVSPHSVTRMLEKREKWFLLEVRYISLIHQLVETYLETWSNWGSRVYVMAHAGSGCNHFRLCVYNTGTFEHWKKEFIEKTKAVFEKTEHKRYYKIFSYNEADFVSDKFIEYWKEVQNKDKRNDIHFILQ